MANYSKPILTIISIICLTIAAPGQENWGPSSEVWFVAGCQIYFTNPSFYDSEYFCMELPSPDDHHYRLYWCRSRDDSIALPGDSLNMPDIDNVTPFVTFDRSKLYFSSDRPGGLGGFDIWVSEWADSVWAAPVNAGTAINSSMHDLGPSLTMNENELYFYRVSGSWIPFDYPGNGRIFVSNYENNAWTEASELPDPINYGNVNFGPSISADGSKLYFISRRPPVSGGIFAHVSLRSGTIWSEPELLNENVNLLIWDPLFEVYNGAVYSIAVDWSGMNMLFTHYYCYEGFISGYIRSSSLSVDVNESPVLPNNIDLTCYPNPFNDKTMISFSLPVETYAELTIFDITGRLVEKLYSGNLETGFYNFIWDAHRNPSGLYFVGLEAAGSNYFYKAILTK
jgi:hypothetical protein